MRTYQIMTLFTALALLGCGGTSEPKGTAPEPSTKGQESPAASKGSNAEKPTESTPGAEKEPAAAKEPATGAKLTMKTAQGKTFYFTTDHDPWADKVVSFMQGKPLPKLGTKPAGAIGRPDFTNKKDGSKYVALGHDGQLVLEFTDNALVNGPGDDLVIFSVGTPPKPIEVSISVDSTTWLHLGRLEGNRTSFDIGSVATPGQKFRFVKIVDGRGSNSKAPTGAEIDAVGALNSVEVK